MEVIPGEGADEGLFCNLACFVLVCVVLICLPFNNNLEDLKNSFIRVLTQKAQKSGKPRGGGGEGRGDRRNHYRLKERTSTESTDLCSLPRTLGSEIQACIKSRQGSKIG